MALFKYQAISPEGKKIDGMINADSFEIAKEKLRKNRILVTKIVEKNSKEKSPNISSSVKLSFTRDLAALLKAKIPLYDCLLTIEEKYTGQKSHALFLNLCDQVKQGTSLSKALKRFPGSFDAVYLAMVEAGEESGLLEEVFEELAELLERQEKIKKKIQSAMIYPTFLGIFCCVILFALFFFLIPAMEELFEGKSLHPMTQCVLSISSFLKRDGALLLSGILMLILALALFKRTSRGKHLFLKIPLKMPLIKSLITQSVLFRFCRILSVLLSSGVPLLRALDLSKRGMNHDLFQSVITRAERDVMEGKKLTEELKKSPLFPSLFSRMLGIAEESGDLSQMVGHMADIFESELEKNLARLTSLLQPVVLLFLGVVIGVIILAVLLPLTDVSAFLN